MARSQTTGQRKSGRRKISNLLALSLLNLLVERPMYPYEMAATLRQRGKDEAIKINWGSLYTVVQNLEKYGFIEAVDVAREGRQPERTTYQITDAGREELKDWLRELIGEPEREYTRFEAALGECAVLPPNELAGLLQRRLDALDAAIAQHETGLEAAVTQITDGSFPGIREWQHYHDTGVPPADVMALVEQNREEAADS